MVKAVAKSKAMAFVVAKGRAMAYVMFGVVVGETWARRPIYYYCFRY